jgi:hypothetical protein
MPWRRLTGFFVGYDMLTEIEEIHTTWDDDDDDDRQMRRKT